MDSQSIINEKPLQTPHLDVDHVPLADKDFQIKDTISPSPLLQLHCWNKDKFLNQNDDNHLWEYNLPKYFVPQVYQFPEIIHLCQNCYIPSQRAIVSPNQQILFTIIAKSINQLPQIQPNPNETPFSIENLLALYLKLGLPRGTQVFHTFILEESHIPTNSPPHSATDFSKRVKQIVTMLSCMLGYTTGEHVDKPILSFLSIFSPGKPAAVILNFSQFLADRIHDQLIRLPNERVFKYSFVLFHMFLYFQSNKFPANIQKLDTKGHPRSLIFWTPLIQKYSSVFSYKEFIDSFVHPVVNMLTSRNQCRISDEIKRVLEFSKNSRIGDWYLY